MSLQSPLFAPLPALVDRDDARPTSTAPSNLSLQLHALPPAPLPLSMRFYDHESSTTTSTRDSSPSSYAPSVYHHSPTSSASASPLVLSLSPHTSSSTLPGLSYPSSNASGPSIDLSSLIPLDSFGVAEPLTSFGGVSDDWTSYGFQSHDHRTLPPLHWADFGGYNPYTTPSSPYSASDATTSSGSTSPSSYFLSPSTNTAPTLPPVAPSRSRGPALNPDGTPAKKECFHCHVTTTPLWRREPQTQRPLCNACGLYLQQRNKLRPQELIDADRDDSDDEINRIPDSEYTGPKCSHCLTRQTSVWRRNKAGQQVCNACGVYQRLRGKERPLSLRRNKIKPRTKHTR
ncbi:GATA zinc finger domain-containing protein [Mycena indigotica]|uniref:GATA zinc finger domain-containing protein n=1 Tax=Mycena indigotica TaxID=2126181 RepID=A0A8H6WC05_9AGAR|nr:GATA zinc finger domain-containing protein [Mycena indigotica]KAF7309243.1 GATA zinc finger domain-containing protein [Mycena indigotica]